MEGGDVIVVLKAFSFNTVLVSVSRH